MRRDFEAGQGKLREDLRVRDMPITIFYVVTFDDDASEMTEGSRLVASDFPFHPFNIHHKPGRAR